VLLHARVLELLLAAGHDRIEAVLARDPLGRLYRIEASQIVVAAGTIESVRLLLASRSAAADGVGNQHDQVGRNFHDHLTITAATLRPRAREQVLSALSPRVVRGTVHSVKLSAAQALCERQHLTPVMGHLVVEEPESSGTGALRTILRGRQEGHLAASLRETLPQLPRAIRDAVHLAWSARMYGRRYISPEARVMLRLNAAQQTPSFSRITLEAESAGSGSARAVLDWRIHPGEIATLRAFAVHLRGQFERIAPNAFEWNTALFPAVADEPLPGLDDARHAMGGACMGVDPRTSVVTPDLGVHGVSNLFVASAAVFPDGSAQLPTLPLMALTLRLAEHLHRQH
jgi:choline dehydrogenase-like flavoprotein